MSEKRVTVTCADCNLSETFDSLGTAREFVEDHRTETGHEPTWQLPELAAGVQRAGDEAGVCGRPGCTDTDSPLYRGEE
ncbi:MULTISPECIES: DUF7542 family protein [Halolamina]|uniref:Uncharacterized protein n=1 Tax=Halolamina pelagica TaxID=699431 RepID=A0A1I5NLB6_9EURY|nr:MULTISPECIES: hypothetical protein [Halolamina]NHX36376.1 hypothetical protein [Halolamina sp. R1-12]SFP22589.1 hypothetical protein SAMN05216277_10290 [Halolamina pelagica]